MTLARFLNQPLVLHKNSGATKDEYGNTLATDFSTSTVLGYLEQEQSVETLTDRDTTVTSWKAWLPAGTDISPFDRIGFNGQLFEVDGAPWQVYNPRVASMSHIVCQLKVVR